MKLIPPHPPHYKPHFDFKSGIYAIESLMSKLTCRWLYYGGVGGVIVGGAYVLMHFFHVSEGVDQFKIDFRFWKISLNLIGTADEPCQGSLPPFGTMPQFRLIIFFEAFPKL